MRPVPVPSARRHLLDRPQRLGFLPTVWFWNDPERQRLVLPIVLSVTLPWMPVLFYLVTRWPISFAVFVVVNALAPYVGMGLIERHIRRELRRREPSAAELGELPVQASPVRPPSARRGYLALAVVGCAGSALAAGQLWGAVAAAVAVLALTAFVAAAWRPPPRAPLPAPTRPE